MSEPTASAAQIPSTYIQDGRSLAKTRARVLANDPALAEGLKILRRQADEHMKGPLWTVMDKPEAGPTGDKHDYVSFGPFFFRNPNTPDGLPYILKDGQFNGEVLKYDRYRLIPMSEGVEAMALVYYLTGEKAYAQRVADQLRTWFLDDRTKMNPHLSYAQIIRGKNQGSAFGLIETHDLTRVVDATALVAGSGFWPADDHRRLQEWFDQYLHWLLTSELGKQEGSAPNNHGPLYDVQVADFALFVGKKELARKTLESAKTRRIAKQIEPDGSAPQELVRTMSLWYSMLNVTGMVHLAWLGQYVGVDLWNYRTADGRSIRAALDYLLPYLADGKPWKYQQIHVAAHLPMVYILRHAARAYNEPAYEKAITRLQRVHEELLRINLLYPVE